jgi:integrase
MGTTKFRGVTIRQEEGREPKYRLSFTYKGIKCRETLDLPISPKNERYAANLLGEIKNAIERGTFRYADFFPKSLRLKTFGNVQSLATVATFLSRHLTICEKRGLAPSTLRMYSSYAKTEFKDFRDLPVTELTAAHIRNWILTQTSSKKTIENKLNLLGPAIDEAVTDGLITFNPLRQIQLSKYVKDTDARGRAPADPFTPAEVSAILKACRHDQERNLFQFAFETGLRTGELIGLCWGDIDWIEKTVHVQRSIVMKLVKTPKTEKGIRKVSLSTLAIEALERQKEHTLLYKEYVFHDPKTAERWNDDKTILKKSWTPALERAKVRYRKAYNTRHTFATMHISQNANLWWLAQQMGHTSPEMLFNHYGKFIKEYADAQDIRQNLVHQWQK